MIAEVSPLVCLKAEMLVGVCNIDPIVICTIIRLTLRRSGRPHLSRCKSDRCPVGVRVHPLPRDDEDIDAHAFEAACREYRRKALYCNPTLLAPRQ